jgi:hypothetical protein
MARTKRKKNGFFHKHSLSLTVAAVLLALVLLYRGWDEKTHLGSFFGNAIADWTGLLVVIVATKHLYEKGSAESRKPPHPLLRPIPEKLRDHSLTIFLLLTGLAWVLAFRAMDPGAKWGQVVGNVVSEWTQIIGIVLLTKKLTESQSKESKKD